MEVVGMEGDVITTQEVFSFKQTGMTDGGKVRGRFQFSGIRPRFIDKFDIAGIKIRRGLFEQSNLVEV